MLQQTRLPDEIVIVDDNSTDTTFQVIENFLKSDEKKTRPQFKLFKNENNLGFAKNFTKALRFTSGDVIVLADQDDIFLCNKIEKIENYLNTNKQIKIFISAYRMIDENDQVLSRTEPFNRNKVVTFYELVRGNSYPGCTIAFKSELMPTFDYFEDSIFTHDWFLLLLTSVLNPNSIFYTKDPLVLYRMHSSNTLGLNFKNEVRFSLQERIIGIQKVVRFLDKIIEILNTQTKFKNEIEQLKKQNFFNTQRIKYLEGESNLLSLLKNYSKFQNAKMLIGDLVYRMRK
jgi:glycosyltransferase involved in cell wall biosynthesis